MLKSISAKDLYRLQGVIIDVRSESEFAEAHVPGALNVPLLNDAERAEVGTLYKKSGPDKARIRGLEIVEPKLEWLLDQLIEAVIQGHQESRESGDGALVDFQSSKRPLTASDFIRPDPVTWRKVLEAVSHEIMVAHFGAGDSDGAEDGENPGYEPTGASGVSHSDENFVLRQAEVFLTQPARTTTAPVTFYCWRGGARSKSMTLFAHGLGFNAQFVTGGHKTFRTEVQSYLEGGRYPFKFCTLYGLTGAGKTAILRQWLNEGKPVIDLEDLAHHRGSAFGQVGIDVYGKQKEFENNLYWQMKALEKRGEKMVFLEGESRRIGRVQLPQVFVDKMTNDFRVKVSQSVEERVQNILRDYVSRYPEERIIREARGALEAIKKRLGGEKFKELMELLESKDFAKFTEILLVDYYDKMYQFSRAPDDFYHAFITGAGDWERLKAALANN